MEKEIELSGGGLCGPSGDSQQLASNISKLEICLMKKAMELQVENTLKNFDKELLISSMLLKKPFKK